MLYFHHIVYFNDRFLEQSGVDSFPPEKTPESLFASCNILHMIRDTRVWLILLRISYTEKIHEEKFRHCTSQGCGSFLAFPYCINNDITPSGTASSEVINKNIRYGGMAPLIAEWNFYSEDKDWAVSIKMLVVSSHIPLLMKLSDKYTI
jgi:hypothetical protein